MLALIAGTGDLPAALVQRLPSRPLICALAGFRPTITPDITFRIEQFGSFLVALRARGVTEICLAGAVSRPQIDPSLIDAATEPLVPRIAAAIAQGDDGALRIIMALFEEAGLHVKAAHSIAPDLLPAAGVGSHMPVTSAHKRDAVNAEAILSQMGQDDSGQACLLRNGQVLARETRAGTDAMLRRFAPTGDSAWDPVDGLGTVLGGAAEWLSGPAGAPIDARGAILFKGPKPDQDRRADLPVVGPQTAELAVTIGLAGIVIEAGGVMVLDLPRVLAVLDAAGMFFWGRPKGGI